MGILDAGLHVGGIEVPYGTAALATRSFEAQVDDFKRSQARLESVGFRSGMQAVRSDRVATINEGGVAKTNLDVLTKGFGMLAQLMLGGVTGPTVQAATIAYKSTFTTTSDGPNRSLTMQMVRPYASTDADTAFTHKGVVCTDWKISHTQGNLLNVDLGLDFQDVVTNIADATPTYPANAAPFDWSMCAVTIDGSSVDTVGLSIDTNLGLKTDRRFLRGSPLKKQPVRAAVPTYQGQLDFEFDSAARYTEWLAGAPHSLVMSWIGSNIASTYFNSFVVTIPAAQWTGESPVVSLSGLPVQSVPFKALDNGTLPVMTIEYTSTDTAL